MLFNSFHFLVFFLLITVAYYILPHKFRWILLLAGSYYFYMCWRAELIVLIVFVTFINYLFSLRIQKVGKEKGRNYLIACMVINFGLLFVFKYLNFFTDSITAVVNSLGIAYTRPEFDIILPMGISFYTFQAAAYTIDVYRGRIKAVRHYGKFSLFISFFPQLVAGPIERSENLLPQFYKRMRFSLPRTVYGLKIMLWGFFKKIVIADRAAVAVNTVYNSAEYYSGLYFVLATVIFAMQIYCDFSGYSDIAKGCAKILGFDLMENFERPFLAGNIKDHWRRWHVSLSSWFMDYVYIPLGGNRQGALKKYRNLLITFMVSGLWHGAAWTYVIWGTIHGIGVVFYNIMADKMYRLRRFLRTDKIKIIGGIYNFIAVFVTFAFVCFTFIFFRSNTMSDCIFILKHILWDFRIWATPQYLFNVFTGMGLGLFEWAVLLGAIIYLMGSEIFVGGNIHDRFRKKSTLSNAVFYGIAATFVLLAGVYYNAGEFIYFQF